MHVSDSLTLTIFTSRLSRSFSGPWFTAVQTLTVEKQRQQTNGCRARMEYSRVQKLNEFRNRVYTLIDKRSPQLYQKQLTPV